MRANELVASVGLAACCAGGANAAIIVDQPVGAGFGLPSQLFGQPYTDYDCAGFDDFTLQSTWDLTSLTVYGSNDIRGGEALNDSVSLWIHTSPAYQTGIHVFGTQVGGDLIFDLTGITLGAGTYWLSAQVDRPFTTGGGQWYWSPSNTLVGEAPLWQNPGGAWGGGTGFLPALAFTSAIELAFTLEGTKVPAPGAIAVVALAGVCGRRRRN